MVYYSRSLNNHPPLGIGGGDGLALSWRLGVGMEILMAKMRRGGGWAQIVMGHGGGDGKASCVKGNG